MIVKKVLLVASAATLMSTSAWALPGHAPSNHGTKHAPSTTPVGPPSTTPNNTDNPGSANRISNANKGNKGSSGSNNNQGSNPGDKGKGNGKGKGSHPGQSHKCTHHNVAYIASGTLASQTLSKNPDGTYSGTLEVEVTHTNNHAVKGKTIYNVSKVHVTFGLADINHDGSVGLDDLQTGDRVKAIGKITTLAKKCSHGTFTATTTIRRIIFHAPK
jgi:hypothetical protein